MSARLVHLRDGTDIDDDDILEHFSGEILMLLTCEEEWYEVTTMLEPAWVSSKGEAPLQTSLREVPAKAQPLGTSSSSTVDTGSSVQSTALATSDKTTKGKLPCCRNLRGDYTMHFGNFILYYNFLTNSLKFIKVYIIRKGISQGRQLWYYFFTKNQHFWENHKKHGFCHFSFKTDYKKIEVLKNCFGIVLLT